MKRLLLISYLSSLLFSMSLIVNAQVGKEFWFVAPEVTDQHGDEPVVLRFTTFANPATITISMPSNSGFSDVVLNYGKYTHDNYVLNKHDVENYPADAINNKGILITSTEDISVYYEVADDGNPDKFTLKGYNALGLDFMVPSQNLFANWPYANNDANEKADIVATEDNTEISIIPSVDITGHKAGEEYTITLNRAQTYCIECRDISPGGSLAGTKINANKRIAVTISDDSIYELEKYDHPRDLIGDQLIPISVIGYSYVVVNTSKAPNSNNHQNNINKIFIMAVEDNTHVFVNNTVQVATTIDAGELYSFDLSSQNAYITSPKPIYVYQVAGLVNADANNKGNEFGSAILPSIDCTGSRSVSFTRNYTRDFWINIVAEEDVAKALIVRDKDGNDITATTPIVANNMWNVVNMQGINEKWKTIAANFDMLNTSEVYTIELPDNVDGLFHLSILDENDPSTGAGSVSYGYFSSFNNFWVDGPSQACYGDQVALSARTDMENYKWYSLATGSVILSEDPTFYVSESGTYWVEAEVKYAGCTQTDSIVVDFNAPEIDLGNDTIVCPGETVTFDAGSGFSSYLWSNGATGSSTQVTASEGSTIAIAVEVSDNIGCLANDEALVESFVVPEITLNTTTVCLGASVVNSSDFDRYEWVLNGVVLNTDPSQNYIIPEASGSYTLTAWTLDGCSVSETFQITVNDLPVFELEDAVVCSGNDYTFEGPTGNGYSYLWNNGSNGSSLSVTNDGIYSLQVTDANGCIASDDASLQFVMPVPIDLGPDRAECAGITLSIINSSDYSNYEWTWDDGSTVHNLNPTPEYELKIEEGKVSNSGVYHLQVIDMNGCEVEDEVKIDFYDTDPPVLYTTQNLCEGQEIEIIASSGYDSYSWSHDSTSLSQLPSDQNIIQVSDGGLYIVEAEYKGCVKFNEITVDEYLAPQIKLSDLNSMCEEGQEVLTIQNYLQSAPENVFDYLYWNDANNQRYSDWTTAQFIVSSAGTYSVTAVDALGCVAKDDVTITYYQPTEINLGGPYEECKSTGVLLQNPVSTAQGYTWNYLSAHGEEVKSTDADYLATKSGTYKLNITDKNGCDATGNVVVTVHPEPTLDLGPDQEVCIGEYIEVATSSDYATYRWNDDPLLNSNKLYLDASGNYKLQVTNSFGCSAQDDINIIVNHRPEVSIQDEWVCPFEIVDLQVDNLNGGPYSYLWSTGETNNIISADREGIYSATVSSGNGCDTTVQASVHWRRSPSVSLGVDEFICPLDGMPIITAEGGPFQSYLWHNQQTTPSIEANLVDTVNWVVVTDEFGCTGYDTKLVKQFAEPKLELLNDSMVCNFDSLLIGVDRDLYVLEWSTGQHEAEIWLKNAGEYWVSVSDGCHIIKDTMQLEVYPTPVVASLDTSIYAQVVLYANGGTQPYLYAINNGSFGESNVFSNLANGDHILCVEDANGCMSLDTVNISNYLNIDIPKFFTPNDDGYNDTWEIEGLDRLPDSEIRIYDRYGKLLIKYKASDPGWDGKYLGKPMKSDDYWYVIELHPTGKYIKGNLTLKR
nr:T9SS type B sorting domain-containing protein [uncultured Carboxylicivirga sp.]